MQSKSESHRFTPTPVVKCQKIKITKNKKKMNSKCGTKQCMCYVCVCDRLTGSIYDSVFSFYLLFASIEQHDFCILLSLFVVDSES